MQEAGSMDYAAGVGPEMGPHQGSPSRCVCVCGEGLSTIKGNGQVWVGGVLSAIKGSLGEKQLMGPSAPRTFLPLME